jgi:hypothetical protein
MPFYPPNPGRRPFSPPGRRPFPPGNRQRFGPPNRIRRQPRSFFASTRNQQAPTSRLSGLRTVMGHVGHVGNGINMLRQMGSVFKFF